MTLQRTWSDPQCERVTIRFSHEDRDILAEAHFRFTAQLRARKIGADITAGTGFWQGGAETSYSAVLIGPSYGTVSTLITALLSAGLEAIQVEREIIAVEEWKAVE